VKTVQINQAVLTLKKGDITEEETEAIVNAANSSLMGGGGVDGAIHRAGGPAILEACKKIVAQQGRLPTGQAVITTGGNLKAKYVIHTVGPVWRGGSQNEAQLLRDAYLNSLKLAKAKGIKSISFPSISTGAYGYPLKDAAKVALKAVVDFLKQDTSLKEVNFVLFSAEVYAVYEQTLNEITYNK